MESRHYSDAPDVNFDHLPELAGCTSQQEAMNVGCPGKRGYLNLGFELDRDGRCVMKDSDRRAPLIVKHAMHFDNEWPELPCVYIQSSGGPNVDGDRYRQIFRLKKGAFAHISTGAATKIAEMRRNYSGMRQSFSLEEGAYLEFLPEPIIPHKRSRFASETDIEIHPTATLFYSEVYMPGRKHHGGEIYQYDVLSVAAHARRPDGTPLFREKFVLRPGRDSVRETGVAGEHDVFANVIVLTPKDKAEEIHSQCEAFMDSDRKLACGVSRLPNEAGLLFKALGMEPGPVKAMARDFCGLVRKVVKGKAMPPEFSWR